MITDGDVIVDGLGSISHIEPVSRRLYDGCGYKWDTLAHDPGTVAYGVAVRLA